MQRLPALAAMMLACLLDWIEALDFITLHSIRGWTREAVVDFLVKYNLDPVDMIDIDLHPDLDPTGTFDATADAIISGKYYRSLVRTQPTADDVEHWL